MGLAMHATVYEIWEVTSREVREDKEERQAMWLECIPKLEASSDSRCKLPSLEKALMTLWDTSMPLTYMGNTLSLWLTPVAERVSMTKRSAGGNARGEVCLVAYINKGLLECMRPHQAQWRLLAV